MNNIKLIIKLLSNAVTLRQDMSNIQNIRLAISDPSDVKVTNIKYFSTSIRLFDRDNDENTRADSKSSSERMDNFNNSSPGFPSLDFKNKTPGTDTKDYKYLHNTDFGKFKWEVVEQNIKKMGKIGDMCQYDYTELGLLEIDNYNQNLDKLNEIIRNLSENHSYAMGFLIRNVRTNDIKTLDRHFLVNNTTNVKELLEQIYRRIDALSTLYGFYASDYISIKVRALSFKVKDAKYLGKTNNTFKIPSSKDLKINSRLLDPKFIPHTMDLKFYGRILSVKDNKYLFSYEKVLINLERGNIDGLAYHKLEVLTPKSKLIAKVEDIENNDTFIRHISMDTQEIFLQYDISGGKCELINFEYEVKVKFIEILKKELEYNSKILSFDLESYRDDDDNFVPYACGFYDGKATYTYYLTDFKDSESMLLKCIQDMITPKYHGYTVYCHNAGKFDYIFLQKIFYKYYNLSKIISKDVDIISVIITSKTYVGKIKPKIIFKDSIRILPTSLEKLCKGFGIDEKGHFPYIFVNKNNLNYEGEIPDIKYYNPKRVDEKVYAKLKSEIDVKGAWKMQEETLKYLEWDLISLYQIVCNMNDILFKKYRINITKYATISGLAMGIYRSNYLKPEYKLANTKGPLEIAIRSAYYGGRTEVFKPFGFNLYSYDYNSLYPTAMLKPMPVGQPIFSLNKDLNKIFGFVKVKVTTPAINIPILPCKINFEGEEKLIFPIGSWIGWYFSEELKLAMRYGYEIEVLESYIFEKGFNYFDDYIKEMSLVKESSTGAMREIHKFLLNTLYGRMGMKNSADVIKIVTNAQSQKIHLTNNVIHNFKIDGDKEYIRFMKTPDEVLCNQSSIDFDEKLIGADSNSPVNSSTCIAAATASWARILMYPYIINSYYSDTDSVFVKKPLNSEIVGPGLGKFKDVHGLIIKAIFPAPKLYYIHEQENNKIITKAKGYTGDLNIEQYMKVFMGEKLELEDTRWRRNIEMGTVIINDKQKWNILNKFSKRQKIYSKGIWIATSPLCVNNGIITTTALTIYSSQRDVLSLNNNTNFNTTNINKCETIALTVYFRCLSLIIWPLYEKHELSLIKYEKHELSLIKYEKLELSLIKYSYNNNLYLIQYKPQSLYLILYIIYLRANTLINILWSLSNSCYWCIYTIERAYDPSYFTRPLAKDIWKHNTNCVICAEQLKYDYDSLCNIVRIAIQLSDDIAGNLAIKTIYDLTGIWYCTGKDGTMYIFTPENKKLYYIRKGKTWQYSNTKIVGGYLYVYIEYAKKWIRHKP